MADEPRGANPEAEDRRGFLKSAAGVTAAVAAAAGMAEAQGPPPKPGRLPANTPITNLGLDAAEIAMLTPAAKKLTKGELLQLQEWNAKGDLKDAPVHLTIQDLSSLQSAYLAMEARQHAAHAAAPGLQGVAVSCCCCSPCCSCCAVADHA